MEGNQRAFASLVNMHTEMAFRVASRIVNDEMEAEDIVQEAFLVSWQKMQSFDPERSFAGWLYRIVVNKCYDALRRRKVQVIPEAGKKSLEILFEATNNPEVIMDNRETAVLIRSLTRKLSPKQKLVFVLIDLEERTHDEVVELTGMRKTVVKSNLNHARRNMGEMINKANS